MLHSLRARRGMVTAPHHLAAQAGLRILRDGGNAVDATIAMAATLAVVYPHMTGIGGDGFWLIAEPGKPPVAVDGCGAAGGLADLDYYRARGLDTIPWRGAAAANTVAGTISGWAKARDLSAHWGPSPLSAHWGPSPLSAHWGPSPLSAVLADAIHHAENGIAVTESQAHLTAAKLAELQTVPGFAQHFLVDGRPPATGDILRFPALAATLRGLAQDGLDSFYRGPLATRIAADLEKAGAPVTRDDLANHRASLTHALSVRIGAGELFNFPPPTQGLASLMILALFDRLGVSQAESFAHIHGLVEATKQAFMVRDRIIADPATMTEKPEIWLQDDRLDQLAARIDPAQALPWPQPPSAGDTTWMGAVDDQGRAVSFIQSIYFEFGSGLVLPQTGILWQNRGSSFSLSHQGRNRLMPGIKPFHTLNPALARLDDGRVMVYGTMGGEGQPQTQAAIFTRHILFGQDIQDAVTRPRWLLGRTWGENSVTLKLEDRFPPDLIRQLAEAGHQLEILPAFTSTMGHAGAIIRRPDGWMEGATDPRSDGAVAGF